MVSYLPSPRLVLAHRPFGMSHLLGGPHRHFPLPEDSDPEPYRERNCEICIFWLSLSKAEKNSKVLSGNVESVSAKPQTLLNCLGRCFSLAEDYCLSAGSEILFLYIVREHSSGSSSSFCREHNSFQGKGILLTEKETGCVQGKTRKKDIIFPSELANSLCIYRYIIFMNIEQGWRE